MTILGALARSSIERPQEPLTSTSLADWLTGGKAAGVSVSEARVLGLPAYYRARSLTAGTLACLPVKVYRNNTRERVKVATVLDNPNPRQTPFEFWAGMFSSALSYGTAYGRKERDGADVVRRVWPIHPQRVRPHEVDRTPDNPEGLLFEVSYRSGTERLTSQEIFRLPYMSPDGVTSLSPMAVFRQSMGIAIAADDSAASLFANGSRLAGILKTSNTLTDDSASKLKARWKALNAGPARTGDIAVLGDGAEFQPIAIPPADVQLLESRQWSVTEIARMIGTPPHLIGDVSGSTSWGTGIEQQVLGWVKFTLQQWITLAEQRITRELLPGGWSSGSWYAEYSLEALLRGDSASRAEFYRQMIQNGIFTRNEVRVLENREEVEGGDDFILPSNLTLVQVDGALVPLSTDGTQSNP